MSIHNVSISSHSYTPSPINDDVNMVAEDPETSQYVWTQMQQPVEIGEVYDARELYQTLFNINNVISIEERLITYPYQPQKKFKRSFKHLTLPEAIVYIEMLANKNPFTVSLHLNRESTNKKALELCLLFKEKDKDIKRIILHYYKSHRKIDIFEKKSNHSLKKNGVLRLYF